MPSLEHSSSVGTLRTGIRHVVVDAGPLIKRSLQGLSGSDNDTKFYTTASILAEVRDRESRLGLQGLVVDLVVRIPSQTALNEVSRFAQLTGDSSVLSANDVQILALAWMLEKEMHGVDHLKETPVMGLVGGRTAKPRVKGSAEEFYEEPTEGEGEGEGEGEEERLEEVKEMIMESVEANVEEKEQDATPEAPKPKRKTRRGGAKNKNKSNLVASSLSSDALINEDSANQMGVDSHEKYLVDTSITAMITDNVDGDFVEPLASTLIRDAPADNGAPESDLVKDLNRLILESCDTDFFSNLAHPEDSQQTTTTAVDSDSGSDSEGWITPTNIRRFQATGYAESANLKESTKFISTVATITSDFAIQNVLMQMGLQLLDIDGMVIKKIKNWVLRCHACFKYALFYPLPTPLLTSPLTTGLQRTWASSFVRPVEMLPSCEYRVLLMPTPGN